MRFYLSKQPLDTFKPARTVQVQLCIGEHTQNQDGDLCITPSCISSDEVNYHFDKVMDEIRQIKQQALKAVSDKP